MSQNPEWVTLERVFDAPIAMVWSMWTDPENFKAWYGPMGMSVPTADMDVTVGGTRKICMTMQTPEREMTMWFTGVYKEITPPTRLVYTEAMCDADGTLLPPSAMGMPGDTPHITEVIVELTEQGGQTHMKLVHVGVPMGSPGEGGWQQAVDKLASQLAG